MDQVNVDLLTKLKVRLVHPQSMQALGYGIIYNHPILNNMVHILTGAHCLSEDSEKFTRYGLRRACGVHR